MLKSPVEMMRGPHSSHLCLVIMVSTFRVSRVADI